MEVDGTPQAMRRPIARLGGVLAQELLNDYVLYKVSEDDLRATMGWQYKPAAFSVIPGGLSITLDPVERE